MAKKLTELKEVFGNLKKNPHDLEALKKAKKSYEMKVVMESLPNDYKGLSFRQALEANFPKENFASDFEKIDKQELAEKERVDMERHPDDAMDNDEEVSDKPQTIVITKREQIKELADKVAELTEDNKKLQERVKEYELFKATVHDASEELKVLRPALETASKKIATLEDELKDANIFKNRSKELQELLDGKNAETEKLETEKSRLVRENAELKKENAVISDLQRQINTFKKTDVDKTTELDKVGMTKAMLEHQDGVAKELAITKANLETAHKNVDLCKARIEELENQLEVLGNNPDEATEALLSGLKEDKVALQEKLDAANAKITELEDKECENCKKLRETVAAKENELQELQTELDNTSEELNKTKELAGNAQANTEKCKDEIRGLKEEKKVLEQGLLEKGMQMDEIEKLQNELTAAQVMIKNRDEDLKKKEKELAQALEREEALKKATNLSRIKLKSHDEQLKEKDEEIGILEEKIAVLEKQAQEKAEEEKPVDFKALADSMEIGELEEKVAKFEKRAKRASIFGKLALIPPLFFLFFPFTPKRSWGGIKAIITYPVGVLFNVLFWVACLFGTLSLIHQFTPNNKPAKEYTAKAYNSIKKVTDEAQIYFSYNPGDVAESDVKKAVAERDGYWEGKIKKEYITLIDHNFVLIEKDAEWKKKVDNIQKSHNEQLKTTVEEALTKNNGEWQEKLKAYLPKAGVETDYMLKTLIARDYVLKSAVEKLYILKTLVDRDYMLKTLVAKDYILKTQSDAAVSQKHKTWDDFYEGEKNKWKKELEEAKKGGTVDLTQYILKKDAEENLRLELVESNTKWEEAMNTVKDELKTEKDKVTALIGEKTTLQQTADLVPGLQKALATYKVYNPAIAAIKIIRMDDQGFIDCPSDKPQGTMTWYIDSFLKRGYPVSSKFQLNKTGLISIHYAGGSLVRDYKGTRYYLVVKAETPKK